MDFSKYYRDSGSEDFRLGYVSDVEGHWSYFLDFVRRSNVLDWEDVGGDEEIKFRQLVLRPNTYFVYGGDSVDKGPGDIRLCRALVSLKQRYPDRVHLLVGNRDLNKLRFRSELSDFDMARPLEEIGKPFWDRNAKSLKEHLEQVRDNHVGVEDVPLERFNTKAERLRYMLKHTLGCPDTFEFRRNEVAVLRKIYGHYPYSVDHHATTPFLPENQYYDLLLNEVTDDNVVESFEYEINHPQGSLRQYLKYASIAAIVGNTIFVHGAIDSLTMKFVPSLESRFHLPETSPPPFKSIHKKATYQVNGRLIDDVHEWVDALNEYLQIGLDDFERRPNWNNERNSRGGEALLAIQNRPSMWGRSVVSVWYILKCFCSLQSTCHLPHFLFHHLGMQQYGDGGVIYTINAMEERKQALRIAEENRDPLAFEGIASNVFDPVPAKWLNDHGISRVVVGHKPTGDCPAVLSSIYTGVEIVSADTSYSRRKGLTHNQLDNEFGEFRGPAIASVEIVGSDEYCNRLETSGILACGTEYSNKYPLLPKITKAETTDDENGTQNDIGDPILGRKIFSGWWVKAKVPPNHYHLCRGSGRDVEYDVRPVAEVMSYLIQN
eukprot:CAMPEP_0171443136 /NCGR_PEP_ID=MMETSP0881-20121228/30168_1 /TAXON_ID=67004 /ORGANISM="Thalassiosira weissflogii, Strain CCMP1336" /LENGTH=604 /DNA_ID=CAMNT_0011966471 /DNA_START=154 /DNA_END=1969 /DNA_ORIENTATION=+